MFFWFKNLKLHFNWRLYSIFTQSWFYLFHSHLWSHWLNRLHETSQMHGNWLSNMQRWKGIMFGEKTPLTAYLCFVINWCYLANIIHIGANGQLNGADKNTHWDLKKMKGAVNLDFVLRCQWGISTCVHLHSLIIVKVGPMADNASTVSSPDFWSFGYFSICPALCKNTENYYLRWENRTQWEDSNLISAQCVIVLFDSLIHVLAPICPRCQATLKTISSSPFKCSAKDTMEL